MDREVAGKTGVVIPAGELLVALGCLLGLRYEEIVKLRWEDIDLDAVHPRTGLPEPVCRIWTPKDNKSRAIPIQADLAVILRAYRKPAGYILEPQKVVAHMRGKKHTYRNDPQRIWNRITAKVEAAGGKRISPA